MSKKPEPPAPADADLFRQAVKDAVPLASSNRLPPAPPPRRYLTPSAAQSHTAADHLSDHLPDDTPLNEFLRPGMDRMTLRKLRRGHWPVQDSIDLHGNTSDEARRLLVSFLQESAQRGLRCVTVIHGKGWRSEGGEGVLKLS